jgi:hypothetical protein
MKLPLIAVQIAPKQSKQFSLSVKKGKLRLKNVKESNKKYKIPDGIIQHLTREGDRNVHDCHIIEATSGSFEKELFGPVYTRGHGMIVPVVHHWHFKDSDAAHKHRTTIRICRGPVYGIVCAI